MSLASSMEDGGAGGGWDNRSGAGGGGIRRGGSMQKNKTRMGATRNAGHRGGGVGTGGGRGGGMHGNRVAPVADGRLRAQESKRRMDITGMVRGGDTKTLFSAKKKPGMSTSASADKSRFQYRSSPYMIDPRDPFMRKWDLLSVFFLCFTALVTPYETAFLEVKYFSALWWINRVIDLFFFCDLVLNFNLIYFDDKTQGYVTNRQRVITKYVKGFFLIDLVSITPFKELSVVFGGGGGDNFKLIRIVRIIRLAKLLRILRSSRIFQRFENQLTISYGLLRLYKFLLLVLVLCHWLACLWNLVRRMEAARCNWAALYFTESACLENADDPIDATPFQQYIVSFYLAVMTTSTVGYGDVSPVTDGERICLVFAMLLGASVYAYVVGNICDIVGTLNQRESEFQEMMDSVNRFIKDSKLSQDLAASIRAFFRYRRNATDMSRYVRIISTLSPQMRGAVALELNSGWMTSVDLFDGCPENLLIEVSFVVKPRSFPPMEEFISTQHMVGAMFIIRRGLVASKGRVKGAGSVFGEDVILANVPYKYTATTLTFVDTAILDRSDLEMILESFPDSRRTLHKRAKRTSIRERMIAFAKAVKTMANKLLEDELAAAEVKRILKEKAADRRETARLPPLDRIAMDLAPGDVLPGTIREGQEEGGDEENEEDADEEDENEEDGEEGGGVDSRRQKFTGVTPAMQMSARSIPVNPRRKFFEFDDSDEMLLPYGGLLNVMMFADERYRTEVEKSATKIQALFRGARTRRKVKEDLSRKMDLLREQIAEEQLNSRMRQQIMVKDGLITAEEAAANPVVGMASPIHPATAAVAMARSPGGLSAGPSLRAGASGMMVSAPAAPPISAELEKIIRNTATRVDKLAEDQKIIFQKITEMYKVVLKGSGSVG